MNKTIFKSKNISKAKLFASKLCLIHLLLFMADISFMKLIICNCNYSLFRNTFQSKLNQFAWRIN